MRLTPDQLIDLTPREVRAAVQVVELAMGAMARGGIGL
jgi:hypothetical protein